MRMKMSTYWCLGVILLIGLLIRSLALSHALAPGVSAPTMDEMNYRELACEILDHNRYAAWTEGFLTQSTRAPLYPLFIASAYSISGSRDFAVPKILNLILDMCAIIAVFILALGLLGERPAIIAAAIYAVFGHAVNYMLISSPHTLAVLLTLLVALALINLDRRYKSAMVLFVFFYTLLIHTRPVFLVVVPLLGPAIYFQLSKFKSSGGEPSSCCGRGEGEGSLSICPFNQLLNVLKTDCRVKLLKSILPIVLIALLCLPWGIRNYRIHKTIVPVCTIAGWHIASNGSFDMKLSLKFLMDHIYAPKHRGFTEGDYFVLGRRLFLDSFFEHPVKLPFFGGVRLVRGWSTPAPWWRFLLPKAYVFPIKVGHSSIIPLPDFEGMIYLFVFANLAAFVFLRRRALSACVAVLHDFRGILVLCVGYAIVHIIGIPLIAYRFIVEPVAILFGVALIFEFYRAFRESRDSANLAAS
ncbi:MAG: glycosyltransferase family 39 protein, partial [Victivallales bacterium]|nr:glycosyltransferase family 39 protein [Victivallales bacterium]